LCPIRAEGPCGVLELAPAFAAAACCRGAWLVQLALASGRSRSPRDSIGSHSGGKPPHSTERIQSDPAPQNKKPAPLPRERAGARGDFPKFAASIEALPLRSAHKEGTKPGMGPKTRSFRCSLTETSAFSGFLHSWVPDLTVKQRQLAQCHRPENRNAASASFSSDHGGARSTDLSAVEALRWALPEARGRPNRGLARLVRKGIAFAGVFSYAKSLTA
jgi:hypothetical protein